jgi:hypothetical protein
MMNTPTADQSVALGKAEYLLQTLDGQIAKFRARRRENRTRSMFFKLAVTLFAALTTILIGIKADSATGTQLQNLALIFSAAGTLFSSWDLFFNYRGLWIRYTVTVVQLINLRSDLDYQLHGDTDNLAESAVDELYRRYQAIMSETNTEWVSLRKEASNKSAT